jgi:hypothetical protein
MQLIAFPCQMILTFIILRSSSFVGFVSLLQSFAKWLANESDYFIFLLQPEASAL